MLSCSKVPVEDSYAHLAIRLLTSLALGRGAFCAWDTGLSDSRHSDVLVVAHAQLHAEGVTCNCFFLVPYIFMPAINTMVSK